MRERERKIEPYHAQIPNNIELRPKIKREREREREREGNEQMNKTRLDENPLLRIKYIYRLRLFKIEKYYIPTVKKETIKTNKKQ